MQYIFKIGLIMVFVVMSGCASTTKSGSRWPACAAAAGIGGGVVAAKVNNDSSVTNNDNEAEIAAAAIVGGLICAALVPKGEKAAPVDPDSDRDGVNDSADACPGTLEGVSVDLKGCPADDDKDGVINDKDQCPNTAPGTAVNSEGCDAVVDSDQDGVEDSVDQCPNTITGVRVDIKGCEIKDVISLRGVTFVTNSDELTPESLGVLNDAAATLRKNADLKVEVAGHTDDRGAASYNKNLSQRRADEVKEYLIGQGVNADNLTAVGYGEEKPVADNNTSSGRAENRRVELVLIR